MSLDPPSRPDRVMLHALALEWNLPGWFDDLDAVPSKSELDAWRWAFRAHGSRTLTAAQKDIVWSVFTFARANKGSDEHGGHREVGEAWPGQALIAELTRSTTTTVGRALDRAEESGWLLRRRVPNKVSRIFFSLPMVLPEPTIQRSRRELLTEIRTPVTTENQPTPDGDPDLRHDGDEPTEEPTHPQLNPHPPNGSPRANAVGDPPDEDRISIVLTNGEHRGETRTVTTAHAKTMIRRGQAEPAA